MIVGFDDGMKSICFRILDCICKGPVKAEDLDKEMERESK